MYYLAFPNDRFLMKLAVGWLYLVGMVQTGLAIADVGVQRTFLEKQMAACLSGLHAAEYSFTRDHFWLSITATNATGNLTTLNGYHYNWQLLIANFTNSDTHSPFDVCI